MTQFRRPSLVMRRSKRVDDNHSRPKLTLKNATAGAEFPYRFVSAPRESTSDYPSLNVESAGRSRVRRGGHLPSKVATSINV